MKSLSNYILLFVILIVLGILYRRFEDKRMRQDNLENIETIQKYLLDDTSLSKSKKPILWIHVPYEYNSRNWLSFGSRTSFDLNQPYLYLTVRSIIEKCDSSFTICLIDDNSFYKLLPGWTIDTNKIASPVLDKIRMLGLMKLLYMYGGMICPISFLCMKDLIGLYNKNTAQNKFFLCETVDRNVTSSEYNFYPNLIFSGAQKECHIVGEFIEFMSHLISLDYTAESQFLGSFNSWCASKIKNGDINIVDGVEIGTKTMDDTTILIEDLLSNNYLNIYSQTYGIYIPMNELLRRHHYNWFCRMSPKQVMESNTIIGNYILVTISEGNKHNDYSQVLEPLQMKPKGWVGFWKTPLYPGLYGQKPNFLGDNLTMLQYTGR
uniref:Uncharacterized protein n=1 Tax=viral metagenome TaxID=1070528 RepID=A0A6C0DI93_9ZZZZ